jgi:hypothetical protein
MLSRNSLLCAKPQNLTKVYKIKLSHNPNRCQLNPFARWHLVSLRLVLRLSSRSSISLLNPLFHLWFPLKFCVRFSANFNGFQSDVCKLPSSGTDAM